jgi:hypothetical protein
MQIAWFRFPFDETAHIGDYYQTKIFTTYIRSLLSRDVTLHRLVVTNTVAQPNGPIPPQVLLKMEWKVVP